MTGLMVLRMVLIFGVGLFVGYAVRVLTEPQPQQDDMSKAIYVELSGLDKD